MCLSSVIKGPEIIQRMEKKGYGWKCVRIFDNDIYAAMMGLFKKLPRNRWLDARNYRCTPSLDYLSSDSGPCYLNGWHIFDTKKDARKWADDTCYHVLRVKFKNVVAVGKQMINRKVIVARFIKIEGRKHHVSIYSIKN